MKNLFNPNDLLMVFELVTRHGNQTTQGQCWQGITVSSSHDGYEVYLKTDGVTLRLGFHNQYHIDYESASQREEFEKRIKQILNTCRAKERG